eukprot:TRINITY_DN123367_c0_g1_i1.p1 TRINITY_DN123367_c0_g1~~TRINITY_DN123367_c0_g1_i1.p1  ORF type:complete len:336 (-),score=38.12 TRINITY_DN123367_c0_g1_i1:963-1970(-)
MSKQIGGDSRMSVATRCLVILLPAFVCAEEADLRVHFPYLFHKRLLSSGEDLGLRVGEAFRVEAGHWLQTWGSIHQWSLTYVWKYLDRMEAEETASDRGLKRRSGFTKASDPVVEFASSGGVAANNAAHAVKSWGDMVIAMLDRGPIGVDDWHMALPDVWQEFGRLYEWVAAATSPSALPDTKDMGVLDARVRKAAVLCAETTFKTLVDSGFVRVYHIISSELVGNETTKWDPGLVYLRGLIDATKRTGALHRRALVGVKRILSGKRLLDQNQAEQASLGGASDAPLSASSDELIVPSSVRDEHTSSLKQFLSRVPFGPGCIECDAAMHMHPQDA